MAQALSDPELMCRDLIVEVLSKRQRPRGLQGEGDLKSNIFEGVVGGYRYWVSHTWSPPQPLLDGSIYRYTSYVLEVELAFGYGLPITVNNDRNPHGRLWSLHIVRGRRARDLTGRRSRRLSTAEAYGQTYACCCFLELLTRGLPGSTVRR